MYMTKLIQMYCTIDTIDRDLSIIVVLILIM